MFGSIDYDESPFAHLSRKTEPVSLPERKTFKIDLDFVSGSQVLQESGLNPVRVFDEHRGKQAQEALNSLAGEIESDIESFRFKALQALDGIYGRNESIIDRGRFRKAVLLLFASRLRQ